MRIVNNNASDPNYDPRPRRVWSQDKEVLEPWVVADEMRRVVILQSGSVLNGAVFIERLKDTGESAAVFEPQVPNTGFSGAAVHVPDAPEAATKAVPASTQHKSSSRTKR